MAGNLSGRNRLKFLREFGKSAGFLGKASIPTFLFFALLFNASLSGVSMYSLTTNSDWQTGTFANTTADSGDLRLNWTRAYDNWLYRRPISISGSASALTDFQVNVTPYIYNETGLVGSWHFSESSGNAVDSSGNGNNGTLINGASFTSEGKFGNAMKFDGTDDYVVVGENIGATADWSVEFWAKLAGVAPAVQYPIGLGGTNGIFMAYDTADTWAVYDGSTMVQGSTVRANTWYFITVTKSGTSYAIYLNGTNENSGTLSDIDITGLNIGRRSDGNFPFNGIIDEVRIYNRALSASEIQSHYRADRARLDYADIRFTDATGTTLLPFWMESDGKFWVKVPSIPTTGTTIYAYYGNPQANDAQNGTGTFEFFDDFSGDLSKWTLSATTSIVSGEAKISATLTINQGMTSKATIARPAVIELDQHQNSNDEHYIGYGPEPIDYTSGLLFWQLSNYYRCQKTPG